MFTEDDENERQKRLTDSEDAPSCRRRAMHGALNQLPTHMYTTICQEMKESYRKGERSYIVNIVHFFEYETIAPPGYDYLSRSYRGQWLNSLERKRLADNLAPRVARLLRKNGHKARVSLTNWSIITVKF